MLLFSVFFASVFFAAEASPARSRRDCYLGVDGQCIGPQAAALLQAVRTSEGSDRQVMSEQSEDADEVKLMHAQSLLHLDTLAKLKDASGALPDTVRTLLATIKNHSIQMQKKLTTEHTTQKAALQAELGDIAACESHLNAVTTLNSDNSSSLKSLAAQALQSLCSCRLTQAQKGADLQGCEDQLACYKSNRDSKSTTMNGTLRNNDGTAKEVYQDPTDMCANSEQWANAGGSSDADKAVAWLTSQKATWASALDAKIKTLQDLQTEYNEWNAKYDALKDGTDNFQGNGCDGVKSIKNTQQLVLLATGAGYAQAVRLQRRG